MLSKKEEAKNRFHVMDAYNCRLKFKQLLMYALWRFFIIKRKPVMGDFGDKRIFLHHGSVMGDGPEVL